MSAFWHWVVIILTVVSIAGSLLLLLANARRKVSKDGGSGEPGDTGHTWDGDLRELNNPLPRWWFNLFIITIVFAIGYLVLYPGLGNFAGTLGWTARKEMQTRIDVIEQKRQALYATFKDKDFNFLAGDPSAQSLGRDTFLKNCAGCHGADARGARGFPNLTDNDWLYGGKPEDIIASITNGRRGQMPKFLGVLSEQSASDLELLVMNWSKPELDAAGRERATQQFAITCAACHQADGKGMAALGSANLTDNIWLHGGTRERIHETIMFGRQSNMPAHAAILSADDIRLVGAYVYGLSRAQ